MHLAVLIGLNKLCCLLMMAFFDLSMTFVIASYADGSLRTSQNDKRRQCCLPPYLFLNGQESVFVTGSLKRYL